jgi:DNA polymerase III subunit alpha
MCGFCHLHVHSDGSLLDGANKIPDMVRRANHFEQPALAITDHGVMYNAWEFYETAKKQGVKPIIGMEAYVAPDSRFERVRAKGEKAYQHLVLLARDREGYRNLSKLSSIGFTEGFYYKPRIDKEVLARHSGGLIVSSACMAGEVAQHLLAGDEDAAARAAAWYAETFPGRYYLEVQAHNSEGQMQVNQGIFRIAERLGLPVVATCDAHFLAPEHHVSHDILICIGLGKDQGDPSRMRYDQNLYMKEAEEIASFFPGRPDVLENTLAIADQVDLVLDKKYHVPAFPLEQAKREELQHGLASQGVTLDTLAEEQAGQAIEAELLRIMARDGVRKRYPASLPDGWDWAKVTERLEYELDVITRCGYAGYHLIVADFIAWSRARGIPVGPGRGSAAGSLVCYSVGITGVCPLTYDLLFERFLNPDRVSMPDIDVDFCYERRGEVIEYVREKYGSEAVAQIVTFGTMKARAAVKDVGRTLGFMPAETDRLAKMIPNGPAYSLTVAEAIEKIPDVKALYDADARYRELLNHAKRLEGLRRHSSVHAAGVVIAPGPVDDYVPVATQSTKGSGSAGEASHVLVTQYDMNCLEKAGMLKMDFLGLKTLTVIHAAVSTIRQREGALRHPGTGAEFESPEAIPLNDPDVYRMLSRGRTAGVFQFESALATDRLRQMRADCINDMIAANALLRPGPLDMGMDQVYIRRKLGLEAVDYPHPALREVLDPTYGVIVYQEQVMRIAQTLGGYTLAQADVLRKAVGKKDADLIKKEIGTFVENAVRNNVERAKAEEVGALIESFGRYGFNKSHSTAYSLIGYQTAWLKNHYPVDFMVALLSSVIDKADDVVAYLGEARIMGIPVLAPDVQESLYKFSVGSAKGGKLAVRVGLGAIRGVGESVIDKVLHARATGRFTDFFDFVKRCSGRELTRKALELLIHSGACDSFGLRRSQMLAVSEQALRSAAAESRDSAAGQISIFGEMEGGASAAVSMPVPNIPELSSQERLDREKVVLGFYVSGHPVESVAEIVSVLSSHKASALREYRSGTIRFAGVITEIETAVTKKDGKPWAKFIVEDLTGSVKVIAFPKTWERFHLMIRKNEMVVLEGKLKDDDRDSEDPTDPELYLDNIRTLDEVLHAGEDIELSVKIPRDQDAQASDLSRIRDVLAAHPGRAPIFIRYLDATRDEAPIRARSSISPTPELIKGLRDVLGKERVLVRRRPSAPGARA